MKYLSKIGRRWNFLFIPLIVFFGWPTQAFAQETETGLPSWVHLETDGLFVYYKPQDVGLYRRLLPTMFEMPETPVVHVYVDDFYKMTAGSEPYREAAVFLLGRYKGQDIWWCVSMPVTTVAARDLGRLGGWPKVIGDISLQRNDPDFAGTVNLDGRQVLDIRLETGQHSVTESENQWFQRLRGIEKLTMVDGRLKVHEARANRRAAKFSLIDLASMNSDKFTMKVGAAQVSLTPAAAGESDAVAAFGLRPQEIVLAFYFRNKFHWSLLHPEVAR
jgi:hypothetical protein